MDFRQRVAQWRRARSVRRRRVLAGVVIVVWIVAAPPLWTMPIAGLAVFLLVAPTTTQWIAEDTSRARDHARAASQGRPERAGQRTGTDT